MKGRLGRGIASIIRTDFRDIRSNTHAHINVYRLDPNPEIPEGPVNNNKTELLAEFLLRNGKSETPLAVQKLETGQMIVVAGERRWRAAILAGIETLPAVIRTTVEDEPYFESALLENLKSDEMDAIESAYTCQRLIAEFRYTHAQLGEEINRDRATISNLIRLLKLPKIIQKDLRADSISAGHSKALLSLKSESEQIELANRIKDQKLSVRRVESEVKNLLQRNKTPHGTPGDALSQALSTKVRIQRSKMGKGKIVISFSSCAELDRICERICNVKISKT